MICLHFVSPVGIFIRMRRRSHIFTIVFALIFGLLHIQPLYINYEVKTKAESGCAKKSRCQKQKPGEEKRNCEPKGCNPFVPCSMGACCYLVENYVEHIPALLIQRSKIPVFNDNTLLAALSECWHPPEAWS
jgi:hypothetical protein